MQRKTNDRDQQRKKAPLPGRGESQTHFYVIANVSSGHADTKKVAWVLVGNKETLENNEDRQQIRSFHHLVIRLIEEEVGSKLLVLVTGEVSLDGLVARETKKT